MSLTYPTKAGDDFKRLPIANDPGTRISALFILAKEKFIL
jgi:hypothetical protein